MNSKSLMWIFMAIGSTIGGYVPTLWGAGVFSFASVIFGAVGAFLGVYLAFKINN